jgi:hypothetical protein
MPPATRTRRAPTRRRLSSLRFDQRLVLNCFVLHLFGVDSLNEFARDLKDPNYELLDEDNVSHFHHLLAARFPDLSTRQPPGPSRDDLWRYDDNIVRHTLSISARRGERIRWKYFQYLALLFTELYLDRYFANPDGLLDQLNTFVAQLNAGPLAEGPIDPYTPADLRKLAFLMATGSGKTLLMHINVLQFQHYLALHGREREINRTILITPNEGLSSQHLEEFERSGLPAELFAKAGNSLFAGRAIEILDIYKLKEDTGEKTVAVDAFEQNNLVLIDEGHRGAGGFDWKDKRDRLAAAGFSFEYSATFGQAIKAAGSEELAQEYARAILVDYSYRHFYADGYGKDYQILNLADDEADTEYLYLTASLLSFYQQLRVYEEQRNALKLYGVERPLWVFVGSSVTKTLGKAEGTDIHRILSFLARFVREREESIHLLDGLLSGDTGLVSGGRDVFAGKFAYLSGLGVRGEHLFADILRRLFNVGANAHLRIEELKGADGELSLRLGDADPFGVINIGDARGLAKLLDNDDHLDVIQREVAHSVFARLSDPDSRVDVLIGSKKFTEGWNSYRVASLGLMNVGKSEGAQIIQLFGRGVRLRGHGGSLKRSSAVPGVAHPDLLRHLETLSIYGLRADYMAQFKQFLEEEGLPTNDADEEIVLPVVKFLPDRPLKTIRVRGGHEFLRDGPRVSLGLPPEAFRRRPITLNCTPKLQVMVSNGIITADPAAVEQEACFDPVHLSFLDLPALYAELVRYKEERGWSNLAVTPAIVEQVLADTSWYRLTLPSAALGFDGPEPLRRVRLWQEIALNLLKKYVERFYKRQREAYEAPLREYAVLTEDDENFIDHYQVIVHQAREHFVPKLQQIQEQLSSGAFKEVQFGNLHVLAFDRHLYTPLVHWGSKCKDLEIKPVPLNEGERDFVVDLKTFYERCPEFFAERELYLLRNLTRGKGIGFFEAGNFYPDFILWLFVGDHQYVTFIDPKGIVRLERADDPKIAFHRTIKDIEREMGDRSVTLNSFIVANTRYADIASWGLSKEELQVHHVLFQQDDADTYIENMLEMILERRCVLTTT